VKIPGPTIIISGLALLASSLLVVLVILYFHAPDCLMNGDMCWGLNGAAWTAISAVATIGYTVLTSVLVGSAVLQIRAVKRQVLSAENQIQSARNEAKINRTLIVCDRYDTDRLLDHAARRLSEAVDDKSLEREPDKYRYDLESLLNYFETISIGVKKGLYDEDIVRDQLERVFLRKVSQYLVARTADGASIATKANVADGKRAEEEYEETMNLYRKWSPTAPEGR